MIDRNLEMVRLSYRLIDQNPDVVRRWLIEG